MSLHVKVFLGLTLVILGGAYWAYYLIDDNIRPQYLRVMEDGMVDHAYFLARQVEAQLPDNNPTQAMNRLPLAVIMKDINQATIQARIYEWNKKRFFLRIYITDAKGIVRYDSDHGLAVGKDYSQWNDVYRALKGAYGARSSRSVDSQGRMFNALYVAFPLRKQGRTIGVLSLARSKASLTGWAERAQQKLWRGALVFASVLFLLAWLLTQLLLQPVFRLTQYARDIAQGRRVPPPASSRDEIGDLTREFIAMKTALWQRHDIEQYVTQLTHELKSPISAIRGAAELLEDADMPAEPRQRFLANIQEQAQRMDDLVQRLLTLVALEQREQLETSEEIQIDPLLAELQSRFLALTESKQIKLTVQRLEDCPASLIGDRFLLAQALANLLQNSFHFTPAGGVISLRVFAQNRALSDGSQRPVITCQVVDTGAGIPDYALERVMEKFYSLEHPDTGKKGTGLGLPFVRQVALLHGGDFVIESAPSQGTTAELWLAVVGFS